MLMTRGVFLMANLVLALCLMGSAAQEREVAGEPEIPTAKLVDTMRLLNTAELSYRAEPVASPVRGSCSLFFANGICWANLPSISKTLRPIRFKSPLAPTRLTSK